MIKQLSLPVFICSILKNHTKTIHYSSQIIYILNLLTMLSVPIYTTFTFQIWRYQCIDLRNTIKFVKEMSPVLWMCIFYLRFVALIFESVHHNKDLGFHEITCKSDSICFLNTPRPYITFLVYIFNSILTTTTTTPKVWSDHSLTQSGFHMN